MLTTCALPSRLVSDTSSLGALSHTILSQKKYVNDQLSLQTTINNARHGNVFKEIVPLQLQEQNNDSVYLFACCKRLFGSNNYRYKLRFQCATCKIMCVCYLCARICHAGTFPSSFTPRRNVVMVSL
jgi:hypothetical protein